MMSCVANVTAYDVVGIVRFRHQVAGVHTDLGNTDITMFTGDFISSVYWLISYSHKAN